MSWVAASLTMFVCSVGVYVAVRKSALEGLSSQFNNLAMFAIPLPIFLLVAVAGGESFSLTVRQALELAGTAIVFAYVGNALSMKSIAIAPNPGYSLMLSKSYVVFTTIWSVVFFNSPLTWRAGIAIAIILGSSALIIVQKTPQARRIHRDWLLPAIGAFFCWGFLSIEGRHLQSEGLPTAVFLAYVFAIVNVCILIEMRARHIPFETVGRNISPFIVIGIAAAAFNFFNFYAIKIAPNIGYVNAINAASIGAVTVVAVVLFKDELTARKLAGVSGMLAGLLLLLL